MSVYFDSSSKDDTQIPHLQNYSQHLQEFKEKIFRAVSTTDITQKEIYSSPIQASAKQKRLLERFLLIDPTKCTNIYELQECAQQIGKVAVKIFQQSSYDQCIDLDLAFDFQSLPKAFQSILIHAYIRREMVAVPKFKDTSRALLVERLIALGTKDAIDTAEVLALQLPMAELAVALDQLISFYLANNDYNAAHRIFLFFPSLSDYFFISSEISEPKQRSLSKLINFGIKTGQEILKKSTSIDEVWDLGIGFALMEILDDNNISTETFQRALVYALKISDPARWEYVLRILEKQLEFGDFVGAKNTFRSFPQQKHYKRGWEKIEFSKSSALFLMFRYLIQQLDVQQIYHYFEDLQSEFEVKYNAVKRLIDVLLNEEQNPTLAGKLIELFAPRSSGQQQLSLQLVKWQIANGNPMAAQKWLYEHFPKNEADQLLLSI